MLYAQMNLKKRSDVSTFCLSSNPVIILLLDNVRSHVAKMTLQKFTDKGYKTLSHPPYSPDFSSTGCDFSSIWTFFTPKDIPFYMRSRKCFKDFLTSKPSEFYRTCINRHHHHVAPPARISPTLSRHSSLWSIALGRSSRLHPVSAQSCCI